MSEWIWESHLPNRLGINRDDLRALRRQLLAEGTDWRMQKKRAEISPAGLLKLETHLRLPPPRALATQPPGMEPALARVVSEKQMPPRNTQEQGGVILHVWRIFPKNRHIIEAYHPGTDPAQRANIVNVQVRESGRFTRFDNTGKPTAITCRHLHHAFYEHTGPMPRRRI